MLSIQRSRKRGYIQVVEEEEKYSGVWWLPEDPDNLLSGTLYVTEFGITLDLIGMFEDDYFDSDLDEYNTILGMPRTGGSITLYDCREFYRGNAWTGVLSQRFSVETAFLGKHIESTDEPRFKHFQFTYTYLSDWIRKSGFQYNRLGQGNWELKFIRPPSLTTQFEKGKLSIEIYGDAGEKDRNGWEAIQGDWFEVELDEPATVSEMMRDYILPLQDFVSFATDNPNSLTNLNVQPTDDDDKLHSIRVIPRSQFKREKHLGPGVMQDLIFILKDVEDKSTEVLEAWLRIRRELDDICDLFFGVQYNRGMFPKNRFLGIAQAV